MSAALEGDGTHEPEPPGGQAGAAAPRGGPKGARGGGRLFQQLLRLPQGEMDDLVLEYLRSDDEQDVANAWRAMDEHGARPSQPRLVAEALAPCCTPAYRVRILEALRRYGLLRGSVLAGWRLLRCHPWARGGVDRVEDQRLFA